MAAPAQYRQMLSDYGPPSLGYTQVQWGQTLLLQMWPCSVFLYPGTASEPVCERDLEPPLSPVLGSLGPPVLPASGRPREPQNAATF